MVQPSTQEGGETDSGDQPASLPQRLSRRRFASGWPVNHLDLADVFPLANTVLVEVLKCSKHQKIRRFYINIWPLGFS